LGQAALFDVFQDPGSGFLCVGLVGADDPGGAALDPAHHIFAGDGRPGAVHDASPVVGDDAAGAVEGHARQGDAVVADGAEDHPDPDDLVIVGVARAHLAVALVADFVLDELDSLDAISPHDLDRRHEEAQRDRFRLVGGWILRDVFQRLIIPLGVAIRAGENVFLAHRVELDLRRIDPDIGVVHLFEFFDLGIGELGLNRSAPPEQEDLLHVAVQQRLEGVIGDVRILQLARRARQHPHHVDCDVSVADHRDAFLREIELQIAIVRVGVVPADELRRGMAARQILTRDIHAAVGLRADGIHDRVVAPGEIVVRDVLAEGDVPEEAEAGMLGDAVVDLRDRFDLLVVGRHAAAHQPERCGQALEHVDPDVQIGAFLKRFGGVEGRRAGTDDCNAEWCGAHVYHGVPLCRE